MSTTTTLKSHSGRFYLGRERQIESLDNRSFTGVSDNILPWPGEQRDTTDGRSFTGEEMIIYICQERQRDTADGRSFTGVSDNILPPPGEAEGNPHG